MKRGIILLLLLALLLPGCAQTSQPAEPYTLTVNDVAYRVDPQNQIITANGWDFPYTVSEERTTVEYPNGAIFSENRSSSGDSVGTLVGCSWSNADIDMSLSDGGEYADCYDLISVVPEPADPEAGFSLGLFLQGALALVLGVCMVCRPETFWFSRYGWHYKDAEPSDRSLGFIVSGGIIAIIIGIICLLAAIF